MSAGDIHSILYRGEDPLLLKKKPKQPEQPKVRRYWPGKAPDYAQEEEDEFAVPREEENVKIETELENKRIIRLTQSQTVLNDIKSRRDRTVIDFDHDKNKETTQVKFDIPEQLITKTQDETPEERRERIRQNALKKRQNEEIEMQQQLQESDNDFIDEYSEEESDYEEEEGLSSLPLLKPVFVPKEKRDTIKEQKELETEEQLRQQLVLEKLESKKVESQQLAIELLKQENEASHNMVSDLMVYSDTEMPDDNDEINEAEEYENWKLREMKRLKLDKEEREARSLEHAEIERRRGLTEEEREIENKKFNATKPKVEKKYTPAFMQKYYHKGAYFQDKAQDGKEDIYLRDYQAPVGEDSLNKKLLPKAMRLRRGQFGRAGQVKHTHLADVDTTDFNAPWAQADLVKNKLKGKMAGLKGERNFDRPKAKKY